MKVTTRQLKAKGACLDQMLTFTREWPEGVEITLEVLERAIELKLDLHWFACNFLPAPTWEAYMKATAPTWKAFRKATAPAWEAYKRVKATAPAEAAFRKAIAPAWATYKRAKATALYQTITEYNL